nr:unnamed protein product [Callosobruchus analis]
MVICSVVMMREMLITKYLKNLAVEVTRSIKLSEKHTDSRERTKIIDVIRKKGNFIHNCDYKFNSVHLIAARRKQKSSSTKNDLPCSNCLAFYAKDF